MPSRIAAGARPGLWILIVHVMILGPTRTTGAQALPGLPDITSPSASKDAPKKKVAAPTKDNPQATVAESSSTIDVEKPVDESRVKKFLEETLAKYPGVYAVHADVDGSVVTLTGHVEDEEVRDRLGQVALKVEGVVFVANQLKTDAQVLSAVQLLRRRLGLYGGAVAQNWLLFLLAVGVFFGALATARFFSRFSEVLLAPFTRNVLLRSVLGSLVSAGIVGLGFLASFQVFGLAGAVSSLLGLAGVAALAIGFAFRDITENFIASILLSTRRPFSVGDFVEVAGRAGVVKALNTRATVLLTLDGKTIRIPNATIFKEIVSNSSSASSSRGTFDVLIPYDVSTVKAMELIGGALGEHEAILKDPAPKALMQELTPAGVKLRAYFWMPNQGVDGFKVTSDAMLKAKVALQQAGIRPPATEFQMVPPPPAQADLAASGSNGHAGPRSPEGAKIRERANLARDSKAANAAAEVKPADDTMQHVRDMSGGDATTEGTNLIARDGKREAGAPGPSPGAAKARPAPGRS